MPVQREQISNKTTEREEKVGGDEKSVAPYLGKKGIKKKQGKNGAKGGRQIQEWIDGGRGSNDRDLTLHRASGALRRRVGRRGPKSGGKGGSGKQVELWVPRDSGEGSRKRPHNGAVIEKSNRKELQERKPVCPD